MNRDEFWNQVDEVMKRSIENSTRSIFDEYIKQNAANRASVGITAKIVRKMHSETCEWCRSLAGVYIYGQEPHEVYQRHDNCDCTVEYFCEKGRQNVWESDTVYIEENEYKKKERIAFIMAEGIDKKAYYKRINDNFFEGKYNLNNKNQRNKLIQQIDKNFDSFPNRDIKIIKENSNFVINPNKIVNYLLKPSSDHFRDFVRVGYKPNDYSSLFNDIAMGFDINKSKNSGVYKIIITMELGVTKKENFCTIWKKDSNGILKFVTAYIKNR